MTLYDYLASLMVNGNPVIWNFKPLTQAQLDASTGYPYVRVTEMMATVHTAMHENNDVMQQLVEIQIFQGPAGGGQMPSRNNAVTLFYDVLNATANVNEGIYNQPLISIHKEMELMPNYDDDTGGLFGLVRFRLLFARSAG